MNTSQQPNIWKRISLAISQAWLFVSEDVWKCKKNNIFIHVIKTLNLSIRCFLDEHLQQKSAALTYQTLLAIVPALALLFAIGKGFGFNALLQSQLFDTFPAQREALTHALGFVEAYMEHMKSGIFVGVGVILLLWTMINLLGNIERTFNDLWNVSERNFARRVTDYIALFVILPVLLVASNGMSIFVSTILGEIPYISSMIQYIMQFSSYVLTWLFFTAIYKLLPNTKVKLKYAFISGIICGTAFNIFQWLYLTGQIWVTTNNAIYGSFAFLPLLMLWMQLSWLICLFGVVLTYSLQNVFNFEFEKEIKNISQRYYRYILITIMAIIENRRRSGQETLSQFQLSQYYQIPIQLVSRAIDDLIQVGLLAPTPINDDFAYIPTIDSNMLTVGTIIRRINESGYSHFVDSIDNIYIDNHLLDDVESLYYHKADKMLVADIPLPALNIKSHTN